MSENEDSYTVVVNEKTLETKELTKADGWIFETWEQHVNGNSIIGLFKGFNNTLYSEPSENSTVVFVDTEFDAYEGEEIQDDWVKIHNFTSDNDERGWIRWKKDNEFLIEFYYSM